MNEFIEVNGCMLEMNHRVVDVERPTLIFLHEGLGSIRQWRDFPEEVGRATGCNTLVYNRAGYGSSDLAIVPRQVTYMHDEGLIVLPALIDALQIGKHILIGHSDGGSIALIYGGGAASPNLLGIITEAAHVFNEDITVKSIEEAKEVYQTAELREKLAKNHPNVDHTFWGWNDIWLHPDFYHWNIEEYLPTIGVPVLVMQGLDDQYGTLAQVDAIVSGIGTTTQTQPPVEKELIPDCMHTPHKEQHDHTLDAMTAFIHNIS
ncbi:MAG: alpha/beta hydrolase [Chloroflexota bacterium]